MRTSHGGRSPVPETSIGMITKDIAAQIIWDTVKLALPVLQIAIDKEVAGFP
jgi:hypothetical protein